MRRRHSVLWLTAFAQLACSSGTATKPDGGTATDPTRVASAAPSSAPALATSAAPEPTASPFPPAVRLSRPKEIVLEALHVFEGTADLNGIDGAVVACTPSCTLHPAKQAVQMWLVDRARASSIPALQPWSSGIDDRVAYTFRGRYPSALYATVWQAGARTAGKIDVKFDGALWQRVPIPPELQGPPEERPPPPEVRAEAALTETKGQPRPMAWGADSPTIAVDRALKAWWIDGKKKVPLTTIDGAEVRTLHRLENGYTFVAEARTVRILDREGNRVPIRVVAPGLPTALDDVKYLHAGLIVVGTEAWIEVSYFDRATDTRRTLVLAAAGGQLSLAHIQRKMVSGMVDLLNGITEWQVDWKPAPPPGATGNPLPPGEPGR